MPPNFRIRATALAFSAAFSFPVFSNAQSLPVIATPTPTPAPKGDEQDLTSNKLEKPDQTESSAQNKNKPKAKNVEPVEVIQSVNVNAARQTDLEVRRSSTAAKLIFGREELDRNGDASIGEILKRLPGVTIGGKPGRGGDIRMRGMGSGYTQILLNGEAAPRGFSMDSLSPDQVERIEVIRGPVAEYSTQAIAGTINIVLREEYKQKDIELKISDSLEQDRHAPNISLTYPGQVGSLSYALNGSIFRNQQLDEAQTHNLEKDGQGQVTLTQDILDQSTRHSQGLQFAPRLSYRFENGDSLMLQPFIMNSRSQTESLSELIQTPQSTAQYASALSSGQSEHSFGRGFSNWQHKFADNSKLMVKLGGGAGRQESSSLRKEYDAGGLLLNTISDVNNTRDSSLNLGAKYNRALGESHSLAMGLDLEAGKRSQTRISLQNGLPQFADSGDDLDASTRRVAVFAQDEFDLSPQWSAYAGLRWEGIRTGSSAVALSAAAVENTSSVWSPVLHSVWRLSGASKDQLRMSLTRSYRAPSLSDLIAIPSISSVNSPTKPDRSGNPNLKPELSTGVDLAYEHYLTRAGIMSANLFVRSIDDLIRRRTELVNTLTGPRWVSAPVNVGHALASGIELEAKFQFQEFFPGAPAIDFRSNYSHFWSRVDDIAGPNNRLDQQPVQTANLGLDYRAAGLPLTLGGSLNWTPAYETQNSDTQLSSTGIKRQIDVYGLWKFSPNLQLRLSANNFQADDYRSGSVVTTGGVYHEGSSTSKTYTTWTLKLEMKI
ncbi:TonB-dependent receptor [Undibacterium sp.]|uniref:TonB-dependent receptor plug domain-containing protein n=1 Tax=Undibacterium sp. TaxID=1914977 RepID=UPI0025EDC6C2|nr:TonB-dependent receptor [Undibacterium sp.]